MGRGPACPWKSSSNFRRTRSSTTFLNACSWIITWRSSGTQRRGIKGPSRLASRKVRLLGSRSSQVPQLRFCGREMSSRKYIENHLPTSILQSTAEIDRILPEPYKSRQIQALKLFTPYPQSVHIHNIYVTKLKYAEISMYHDKHLRDGRSKSKCSSFSLSPKDVQ